MSIKLLSCAILGANLVAANAVAYEDEHKNHGHHHGGTSYTKDHFHDEGEFMVSYKYMGMLMKGLKDGDSDITPADVVSPTGSNFLVSATRMTTQMHMLGAMYGLTDDVNLMVMGRYIEKDMNLVSRAGAQLKSNTEGFGDTDVTAMVKLAEDDSSLFYVNAGLSLPTGSIDEQATRVGAFGNLPYAMQLGSGTYDPILGLAYSARETGFSWGTKANAKFRFGSNNNGYRLGDEFEVSTWVERRLAESIVGALELKGKSVGSISGADPELAAIRTLVQTADETNYGGETLSLAAEVSLLGDELGLDGHQLSVQYSLPVYQNLNGPQLGVQHSLLASYQVAF